MIANIVGPISRKRTSHSFKCCHFYISFIKHFKKMLVKRIIFHNNLLFSSNFGNLSKAQEVHSVEVESSDIIVKAIINSVRKFKLN